jgi:ABC-type nitrate/sulfonate/bicarbonate transport system permease component
LSTELLTGADTASAGSPARRWVRRPGRRSLSVAVARLLTAFAVLLIWQYAPQGVVPTIAVSRPLPIIRRFGHLVRTGELFSGTWATAEQVLYSLVLGALIGVVLAILTWAPIGRWLLGPLISASYAIPKVGLISFYILLLGVDTKAHVVFVTGFVLFAYYFAVRDAFGASRLALFRVYVLPSAVPYLFTATRIAVPLAFASEVFAELEMPTATGLGVSLEQATDSLDASTSMAIALFIVLIGYLLDLVIGARLRRYTESIGTGLVL